MWSINGSARILVTRALQCLFLLTFLTTIPLGGASALEPEDVELTFSAEGTDAGFWSLRMRPGQSRELSVAMGNSADRPILARTYPANVTTALSGGLQVSEAGAESEGATRWLSYEDERVRLGAGAAETRRFSVTVPTGTASGDYTAAVALQNARPATPDGQDQDIQFGQILRKVLTVKVRVPGPYTPELTIDGPSLIERPASSTVQVEISNTGNENLYPSYEAEVRDTDGVVLGTTSGTMDKFYAGTQSALEINVDGFLSPGSYSVNATLTDERLEVPVNKMNMPLQIGSPPTAAGEDPQVVNQGFSYLSLWPIGPLLLVVALGGVYWTKRSRTRQDTQLTVPPSGQTSLVGMLPPTGTPLAVAGNLPAPSLTLASLIPVIGDRLKGLHGDTGVALVRMSPLVPGMHGSISVAEHPDDIGGVLATRSSVVLVSPPMLGRLVRQGTEGLPTLVAVEDVVGVGRELEGALRRL